MFRKLSFVFIILVIIFTAACGGDRLSEEERNSLRTMVAQNRPAESPDDTITCQVGKSAPQTVTRQFCEEADGEVIQDEVAESTTQETQGDDSQVTQQSPTTPASTPQPALQEVVDTGSLPDLPSNASHGAWEIQTTGDLGSSDPVVAGWLHRLPDPAPSRWKTFPNIPNVEVPEFRVINGSEVPDGVEYGTYNTPYCWSSPCDVPVGAWEYRYITGDYQFLGNECKGDGQTGCMLLLINVMDASYTFRNQYVDNGFTLRGRYWNGDALEWGVWGLVSHGSANMLNMETFAREGEILNSGDPGNSGANCGTPNGCGSVDVLVIAHSGDRILATAHTVVTRP